MYQICRLKKYVGYTFSMFLLGIVLNACSTTAGSLRNERKNDARSISRKVVYILNGLWQDVSTFDDMVIKLSIDFKSKGLDIEIRKLPETITSEKSITQQATDAFAKIKRQLAGINHEVILVGHSQGGLRGAKILFLNEQEGKPLNIKGLVTLGTPWEGAPAATITKSSIHTFMHKRIVKYAMSGASYVYPTTEQLTDGFIDNLFDQYFPTHEPGVQDIVPDSDFLQELASSLSTNSTPILAIGGKNRNVEKFISRASSEEIAYVSYIRKLPPGFFNMFYARLFAGGWRTEHDMMVPLYSQIAKNIVKSPAFDTYIIKGAIHDFLPGLSIPEDKIIYNQTEAITRIVEFVSTHFNFEIGITFV
jgi:pimeloyl-ACP methyl ester carboxylesterase